MSFLAPGWLVIAATAAAVVVGLHLLNRQRLRSRVFPTVRFIPDAPVRAVSRSVQPTDLVLLALRVATLALVGLALARPVPAPPRRTAVIALVDRSPAGDSAHVAAAVRNPPSVDIAIDMTGLSAGLVAARNAAARLSARADSVALVIVSPLAVGLWDAATESLRASWPGRVQIRRVTGVPPRFPVVVTDAPADGLVRAALSRLGQRGSRETVHLRWPQGSSPADTTNAVYSAGAAIVGRIPRWPLTMEGRAIAWFADGTPAVIETPSAQGCERNAGFRIDQGDALLRPAGLRVMERLIAPCGAGWTPDLHLPADSASSAALAGSGPNASARDLGPDPDQPIALLPLVLALLFLGGERVLRWRTP